MAGATSVFERMVAVMSSLVSIVCLVYLVYPVYPVCLVNFAVYSLQSTAYSLQQKFNF